MQPLAPYASAGNGKCPALLLASRSLHTHAVVRPTSVTLETWVAFDVISSGEQDIIAKPVGPNTYDSYILWMDSEILHGTVGDAMGEGPHLNIGFSPHVGRWYHLAYTFDESTHQQALYIDGEQVATGITYKSIGYDDQPVLLGRDTENGIPGGFFPGRIDEASIYNRALSSAEIASIYNAGSAGKRL